jgi:sugar phosphate isomerase/epimerase
MFKCLSPGSLGITASPNELIEPALSSGFKGLELDVVAFAAQVERDGMPTARRLLDSAKLKLGYFQLPLELAADDAEFDPALEALRSQAKLAAELGCTRAVTKFAAADVRPLHQNFDFHKKRVAAVAKVLEEHGVQLGLGFIATSDADARGDFEFIRSFEGMSMLLAMAGGKNVGVAVDLFDLWSCYSSFEAVRQTKAKIVAVFVADAPTGVEPADALQDQRLLPGETGVIDTSAVLTALGETGYDGPVVPLPHPARFKQTGRQQIFKLAGEKLDQAWKAAGLSPLGKLVPVKR